jgi:hypothetical protein
MQFIIRAMDYKDKDALARRMEMRQAHLDYVAQLKAEGKVLFGAALLDEDGNMCGSIIVCDFSSRAELDAYLESDPYVTGLVWEGIDVTPCKVAPSFAK